MSNLSMDAIIFGFIARENGLNPFDIANSWSTFEPISKEAQ